MGSQTLSLCGFNQLSMFFESNPPIKLDDFRLFNFIILITGAIGMSYSKNWLPHVSFFTSRKMRHYCNSIKTEEYASGRKLIKYWLSNLESRERVPKNVDKDIIIISILRSRGINGRTERKINC